MHKSAIVTGAGIVGLAMARALAVRGYEVTVLDRARSAMGASVRNFGMVWPIGQPDGDLYERAVLSRGIWKQICDEAGAWYEEAGSLHLAYNTGEWSVLQELAESYRHRNYQLLTVEQVQQISPYASITHLKGGLYSNQELIVDPRKAIPVVKSWLEEKFNVQFINGCTVTDISYPDVYTAEEMYSADKIFVCSGADFETLYPGLMAEQPLVKCKLQMMRLHSPDAGNRIGPALCAGLSLIHYTSFRAAPSLPVLKQLYQEKMKEYLDLGIHVMVSQNQEGMLTVGDSHEYGDNPDPFDRSEINELILRYLADFTNFGPVRIAETWNGVYAKLSNGDTELILEPENGVTVVNGLGGAGMTLSFGLAESLMDA
ncbi:MAG TPA: TIGR03364 family FAD-dependent oxidoreductase [Chitinophagaceae bacterium]|nr:TIGR03364 family FAD-dependent oxidoreductase [Chitinophagaceae bacterium]